MLVLVKKYFSLLVIFGLLFPVISCSFFKKDVVEEDSVNQEEITDENQDLMFNIDEKTDFYGIDLLVLKINFQKDHTGRVVGVLPEGHTENIPEINKNNPDYYLSWHVNYEQKQPYESVEMYSYHKTALQSLLGEIPGNSPAIILMYVNGSNLKNYSDRQAHVERTIYSQIVTSFLYYERDNLVIEKRYHESIPEDEIFLVAADYQGEIPINVYNSASGNVLEWLSRYQNLEKAIIEEVNRINEQLENSVNTLTRQKDIQQLATSVVETDEEEDDMITENDIILDQESLYDIEQNRVRRDNIIDRRRSQPQQEVATDTVEEVVEEDTVEEVVEEDTVEEEIVEDTADQEGEGVVEDSLIPQDSFLSDSSSDIDIVENLDLQDNTEIIVDDNNIDINLQENILDDSSNIMSDVTINESETTDNNNDQEDISDNRARLSDVMNFEQDQNE